MNKPNDFLAAQINAPEDFTLADFYAYNITPDNTDLKPKDYYKDIPKVKELFSKNGEFDEDAFNQFYDSAQRSYNEWSQIDFTSRLLDNYARAPENIRKMKNTNVRDTSAKLFVTNDPWRHQVGFGNLYEVGKEGYDIREVAQANNVRDAEGNILDWTPNDKGGLWKGLFRNPMALAYDANGQLLLDEDGDPFYRELKDGESTFGKEMLHYSDTITAEDSWLNKYDFFDNDGLDKSVGGTIMRTLTLVAPYLIPGVGPWLGAAGAVFNLAKSLPTVAKAVNGIVTNNSDETNLGKTLNNIDAFFSKFDTSKSRHSLENQWSFENIGDMVVTSAKQLFEQRTFTLIPEILKLDTSKLNPEFFKTLSLGYMALTSAEDSLETFKNAGMSDVSAGISMLAYTAAMFGLMNNEYFKDWLFRNSWVNATPEITNAIKDNSKIAAKVMQQSIQNATKGNPKLLTLGETATKPETQKLFSTVFKATKEAWATKSIDPLKGLDIILPGAVGAGNVYIHHALNEGLEEVMEEMALDGIKLVALGIQSLGFDISDETKEKLDFGLTWNDAFQRYSVAFVGGAIGGAVFQGMDDWHTKLLNKDLSNVAGRGANGELIRAIRLYGEDRVIKEAERLKNKKVFGDTNLTMKGRFVSDPTNEGSEQWVWDAKQDGDISQNDYVFNVMKNRIQTISRIMRDENLLMSDNEILKGIQKDLKEKAEKEGLSEDAYYKKYGIQPFDEFAKKTGFADIVLTDVGNLMIDVVQLNEAIEARKADLFKQYPDTMSSERDSAISKDPVIKNLEKQKDAIKQQLEDIESGKSASYYIRYANFASHSTLVSKLMSANGNDVLDKNAFAYWKYRTLYNDAGEDLKKVIDADYNGYIKLNGIAALEAANTLYQHAVDLVTPKIESNNTELSVSKLNPTVVGNYVEDLDEADTSSLLNREGVVNEQEVLKEVLGNPEMSDEELQTKIQNNITLLHQVIDNTLTKPFDKSGQPYTPARRYRDILNFVTNFYTEAKKANNVGINADDFVKYAFKRIGEDILNNSKNMYDLLKQVRENSLAYRRANYKTDDLNNVEYAALYENDPDEYIRQRAEELKSIPYDEYANAESESRQEELRREIFDRAQQLKENFIKLNSDDGPASGNIILKDDSNTFTQAKNKFDEIASKLATSPEEALELIDELEVYLSEPGIADDTIEDVSRIFQLDNLRNIAKNIKAAVDISKTMEKSPALELAKIIAFDLTGEQNTVLDLIEYQKGQLAKKTRASEFLMSPERARHLAVAEKVLPIVQGVLWASANGINEEANKMLVSEGKEQLPIIDQNLWYIYKNDLQFIQNQLEFLRTLNDSNLHAKTREQILVRNNFYGHITELLQQEDAEENPIELITDLQKALQGYDLVNGVAKFGLLTIDYTDQSKENQIKMMKAFADLEHDIYEHVKNSGIAPSQVGRDIMNVFNDSYKLKNGVLSKKFEDGLKNFDISTYFLAVVGYDSYELSRKLKSKFESDGKFPFFGQELAIRLIAAEIQNPDLMNGAIEGISDTLDWAIENNQLQLDPKSRDLNEDIDYLKHRTKLFNTIIIDGFAGTGKSTVVFNTAISFFDDLEIVGVSKIASRAEAMGLDSDHTFELNGLMTKGLKKEYSEKDNLIGEHKHSHVWKDKNLKLDFSQIFKDKDKRHVLVIDECTLIKEGVWEVLCNSSKEQGVTIIGLGNLMQRGEVNETTNVSAGLDDCVGIFSTKLTVSMRDANFGKSSNNEYVGRVVSKLIDAKKEHPNWQETTIVEQNPTGPIVLQYAYDSDEKLCGDTIVQQIEDGTIDSIIATMADSESLMVITPDGTFNALREKYKADKRIKFVPESDAQGSEADYVVLNIAFDSDVAKKFPTLQKFYTLLTRAKKGTVIKSSNGLNMLQVSHKEDPGATNDTGFDPSDAVTLEYKETRLAAINSVPEQNPIQPKDEENPIKSQSDDLIDEDSENSNQDTQEEIIERINQELDSEDKDAKVNDSLVSGDEQLGVGLKGEKLKAYKKYVQIKESKDAPYLDIEDLAQWIINAKVSDFGPYSGINTNISDENLELYKNFVRGVSSILLNHPKDAYEIFRKRSMNISDPISNFASELSIAFENSIKNKTGVYFKRNFGDKMMLYYCFDKYAIPVSIYIPDVTEAKEEGFCTVDFTQQTPIIPITSQGKSRRTVNEVLPKSLIVASQNGKPVTPILLRPDESSYNADSRKNKYFVKGSGKAFTMLLHEFGISDSEILEIFSPERDENGIIDYFLKNNPLLYSISGVQQDIGVKEYVNILDKVDRLLTTNLNADENQVIIEEVAKFFGKTEDEVKSDFEQITELEAGQNIKLNGKRFGEIRRKYGLLYTREINSFITALFAHFSSNDDQWAQFTENILANYIGTYTSRVNGESVRHKGLSISLKDKNDIRYNWYIIPTVGANPVFEVYYTNEETAAEKGTYITTFNYNDIIQTDGKIRLSIENIISRLFDESDIKAQMLRIIPDFDISKLSEYIQSNTLGVSLTTGVEDNDRIDFYPPFESSILRLIDNTDVQINALANFIKNSTIFKYGLYRQIAASGNDLEPDIWTTGDVLFEALSWDIVAVLTPLYTIDFESINDSELRKQFDKLRTPNEANEGVVIETQGNTITFSQNDESIGVRNEAVLDFLNKSGYSLDSNFAPLVSVFINDNSITFTFRDSLGEKQFTIDNVENVNETLHELFKGYANNDVINYSDLVNEQVVERLVVDGDNVQLIRVNNRYLQLKINNKRYSYKHFGNAIASDGTKYAYISSNGFNSDDIVQIQIGRNSQLDVKEPREFLGYVSYDLSGGKVLYYLNDFNQIERIEDGNSVLISPSGISTEGLTVNVNGLNETISFNIMSPFMESKIKQRFDTLNVKFSNNTKVQKKKNTWKFFGNVVVSRELLRNISDYSLFDSGIVNFIDFKGNRISVNGAWYNLIVSEEKVKSIFNGIPEYKNFEKDFRSILKPYSTKLLDLESILSNINVADDPLLVINSYLESKTDALSKLIRIKTSSDGSFEIEQPNLMLDTIIQNVISAGFAEKYSDVNIEFTDENISNSQKFVVNLQNDSISGEVKLENGEWKVELMSPNREIVNKKYFIDSIAQLYSSDELDQVTQEFLNLMNSLVNGKTKLSRKDMGLSVRLQQHFKGIVNKPISEYNLMDRIAKLNDEWTTFNQNCKY